MTDEATKDEKSAAVADPVDVLVMPDIGVVTGEQVRVAMIANKINYVDHHECGGCGAMVYYSREGDQLYFNPQCDCGGYSSPEPREWEDAAGWINMQSNTEIKNKLAKRFGVVEA
jgi:hypothetical protein